MSPPGTLIHTVLDKTLQFFQESKNRERIQTYCIDPLMRHVLDRLFPYIILTCILFTLILLMSFDLLALYSVYKLKYCKIISFYNKLYMYNFFLSFWLIIFRICSQNYILFSKILLFYVWYTYETWIYTLLNELILHYSLWG